MRKKLKRMLASLALCAVLTGSLAVPASAAGFQDVPAGHWAADEIQRCVEKGFFNGQSATRFGLGEKMSRSAVAVVLCRFFGWENETPAEPTFSDVPADVWYAGAVEAAVRHGALTNSRGVFRPNDPVTRQQLVTILFRYSGAEAVAEDHLAAFADADTVSEFARDAMNWAVAEGVINGVSADLLAPHDSANRAQICAILVRYLEK